MNISPVEVPLPAEYLSTGDHALIVAWAVVTRSEFPGHGIVVGVLVLEDGHAVIADTTEFKFDYRYDVNQDRWVDVSGVTAGGEPEDGEPDQEPPSDGGEGVQGLVRDPDGASPGDPGDEGDQGPRGLDPGEGSG